MSKYAEVYDYIKNEIKTGQVAYGGRLPSVRKASELFSVSRTTIQNAYFALAEDGYIISEPQSGYYVSYKSPKSSSRQNTQQRNEVIYDFSGSEADSESFDFDEWRRHMKAALRQNDRLLSYSEAQGEEQLRQAISEYILEKRNVAASTDRIVIGAGVQSLLHVLCALIDKGQTVSFPDKSFVQGAALFEDYGFEVKYRYKDAGIIYVSPSHMTRWGDVMPNRRRIELTRYSAQNGNLVIEDDYESDFQYNSRPTPSLYALSGGSNVVYIGSFSRLLLPSIRISFMILTPELTEKYREHLYKFSQTASKTEQIALYSFIRDGRLMAQIRKTRRFYTAKTKMFYNILKNTFGGCKIEISENLLQVILHVPFSGEISDFERNGIKLYVEKYENGIISLVLSPSSIAQNALESAAKALKKSIEK